MTNSAKIYTSSTGGKLNLSTGNIIKSITATNNRAQYYAEQAKKYRDEAKVYSEKNSDVTLEHLEALKTSLKLQISSKQPLGDYALRDELPQNVSELANDLNFTTIEEMNNLLPAQHGNTAKFLYTNGSVLSWENISGFTMFDIKISDHILQGTDAIGWILQGSLVTNTYPKAIEKFMELYATATDTVHKDINCKLTVDGRYIANSTMKERIDSLYQTEGVSDFYIIDIENNQFYLPSPINISGKFVYFRVGDVVNDKTLIDIGNVLSELSLLSVNKLDIDHSNDTKIYLKEKYINGESGYKIWSDGYCEQWGVWTNTSTSNGSEAKINLLKKFANTQYLLIRLPNSYTSGSVTGRDVGFDSKSTDSFTCKVQSSGVAQFYLWQAHGYLAEGEF